ncbi:MAG: YajG family lipoprotein [Pseudomonadota bacterium]
MKLITLILCLLMLQACAFTDAQLEVQHSESADIVGPISEPEPLVFSSPVLTDNRADTLRIGWKKNGFGQNTADITTAEPVEAIVQAALVDAIEDNGHSTGKNPSIAITGTVDRFWFDMDANFWTIDFIGDVKSSLRFADAETSEVIYESSYQGTYKERKAGGLEKSWTEVMGKAVDMLIEEIVYDDELAEAIRE